MGYRIVVDHTRLTSTAKKINDFVSLNKSKMRQLTGQAGSICHYWSGRDYQEFIARFNNVASKNSVSGRMDIALKNYANCLEFAAGKYKRAQANAVNRANKL